MPATSSWNPFPANAPIFLMEGAHVLRQGVRVLSNLNWRVHPGQHWAVLGATGAGKSTLAAAMAGHAVVTGEMRFQAHGKDLDPRTDVAAVSFDLQRTLLARPDAYHHARWYQGEAEATAVVREVLAETGSAAQMTLVARTLGLGRLLKRRVLELSMGETRRLLIARAWLMRPRLLLLDEPYVGLDSVARVDFSRALRSLMRSGPQLIVFTARPEELPRGLTHALWLKHGRVLGDAALSNRARSRQLERLAFPKVRTGRVPSEGKWPSFDGGDAPMLEMRGIRIEAAGVRILDGIDWTVRAGERWALSGPNGAGKTTLLSLVTGDHPQSFAQDVRLFGRRRADGGSLWEWKAAIGWAAPDVAMQYQAMTRVFDLVCSGYFDTLARLQPCTQAQERTVLQWLRYVGLGSFADRPFRTLSDGQQRLALFARACIKRPRLLILDEPCQGLDAAARARVLGALDALCRNRATTLILVTHYASELPHGITHRLELRRGCVHACGSVRA